MSSTIASQVLEALQQNNKLSCSDLVKMFPDIERRLLQKRLDRQRRILGFPPLVRGRPSKKAGPQPAVKKEKPTKAVDAETFKESRDLKHATYWQDQYKEMQKRYNESLTELVLVDRLVEVARTVIPHSYDPAPDLVPHKVGASSAQSAVLLLSDTHIGKVVDPGQTLYFGNYNFQIFLNRLKHLETRVISILMEHTSTKINKLLVAMLGDMVDGALSHGAEAGQVNTVFTQVYHGAHAVAQFLRNISAYVPEVECLAVVGNHGRWGTQHKMPTKNRYSNLDMFFYAQVQALVRDIPKIKFPLNEQPFQTTMLENSFLWFGHGDHLKGGDKAMGMPLHAIGRQLSATTQMFVKNNRQVPNIYCVGDKHKRVELPHALGDFLINGAFPGYDEYAHSSNFTDTGPDQKLFLVHPKYGRSATYNIQLAYAQEVIQPYSLPTGFKII